MDFFLSAFLLVLCLSGLFVCHNGVEGSIELSAREDLELENQLKFLNKPALKTIQTEYGDIYDCVDFYNQPAFDHPLLKNHSFHYEMKPTSLFRSKRDQVRSKVRESVDVRLKDGGCPVGTVPIRRITKDDLIRERNVSKIISPLDDSPFGAHYAVVRTIRGAGKFNGGGAALSVHHPGVFGPNQNSEARIKVQNGVEAIQVGWRVDPGLYGDALTRAFIRVDAGQSHCFNTRCPGFVLVRSDIPLDAVYEHTSKYGGPIYEIRQYIQRDLANGNWWLLTGDNNDRVGFWPKRIFSDLADSANYVEWGGKVYSPTSTSTPDMGSGQFEIPVDTYKDAYCRSIEVFNDRGQNVDAYNTETFRDTVRYEVADITKPKRDFRDFRHLVVYGGQGQP